jgi:hypothetical protein
MNHEADGEKAFDNIQIPFPTLKYCRTSLEKEELY